MPQSHSLTDSPQCVRTTRRPQHETISTGSPHAAVPQPIAAASRKDPVCNIAGWSANSRMRTIREIMVAT
jgi:hypothetical protein